MVHIDGQAINGVFKLQIQTQRRRVWWIILGVIGLVIVGTMVYLTWAFLDLDSSTAPTDALFVAGGVLLGLLMIASSIVVVRKPLGVHLEGIKVTQASLEKTRLFAKFENKAALRQAGLVRLCDILESESTPYPSSTATVVVSLAPANGVKRRFYLALISIRSGDQEALQLMSGAHRQGYTYANDLCVIEGDILEKFRDTRGANTEGLSRQLERLGALLEGCGCRVLLDFRVRATNKIQAGAMGGIIGGLVASGIDRARQERLRLGAESEEVFDAEFARMLREVVRKFKWEVA